MSTQPNPVDQFVADTTKYVADVQAALQRAQATFDALNAALANAGLTSAQLQALKDADAAVNAADTAAQGFDPAKASK
jgi:hypothetical protein